MFLPSSPHTRQPLAFIRKDRKSAEPRVLLLRSSFLYQTTQTAKFTDSDRRSHKNDIGTYSRKGGTFYGAHDINKRGLGGTKREGLI